MLDVFAIRPYGRDTPLTVKYDTKPIWRAASEEFLVGPTGAAIGVALYEAGLIGGPPISYSRSKDHYAKRKRHPLLSFRKVITAVDILDRGGWIDHQRQVPGGRGWQSTMMATPPFLTSMLKILGEHPPLPLIRPFYAVLLRDQDGVEVELHHSRELERMNRQIRAINEALTSIRVVGENGAALASPVVRIFNEDPALTRGGRMYAFGNSWQNIPKRDRGRIKIDDEHVVEIDYSAIHPTMLYAEAGVELPTDCYAVGSWPRSVVKMALLTLINAQTIQSARLSLAHNVDFGPVVPGSPESMRLASRLIDEVKQAHWPIAGAFHSDAGARLMRKDSDLAVAVVTALMKQGIVALPIHDSFLVPASKRDALKQVMLCAAQAVGLEHIRVAEVPISAA